MPIEENHKNLKYEVNYNYLDELSQVLRRDCECAFMGYQRAAPGGSTKYHIDPNILHVTYTKSGYGKCTIGEIEYPLKPGNINIIYPYEPHAFESNDKAPYFNYNLKVHFEGIIPCGFPRLLKTGRKNRKFERIFSDLYQSFHSSKSPVNQLKTTSLLIQLFTLLLELSVEHWGTDFPKSADDAFAKSISQLQHPPFIFPGLNELAAKCGMSKRKYTDFFRNATGLSLVEFWMKAKMSYALQLLKKRKYSIKEIAMQCGFSNSQNFIRAFKKKFGTSPAKAIKKP